MTAPTDAGILTPSADQEPKSGALARLAAGIGGLVMLAGTALASFGTVVMVLVGVALIAGVQRKRGRALTRSGYWVAACAAMAVILLSVSGVVFSYVPRGALDAAKQSMDSSSVAASKRPPPALASASSPCCSAR